MSRRQLYRENAKVKVVGPLKDHQKGHVSIGQTYYVDIDYEDLIYLKGVGNNIYFYPEQLK